MNANEQQEFQEFLDAEYELWLERLDPANLPRRLAAALDKSGGHGARPLHPDWARQVRDQCQQAGVPFFFKQWGEWVPKSPAAGRLLDGVERNEFPSAISASSAFQK